MGRAIGFIGLLIAVAVGAVIYTKQAQSVSSGGASPKSTIESVGVRSDLMAIANAERRRLASDGKYVSLEDLRSNGDISMPSNKRGFYTYAVEVTENSFRVTATYSGNDPSAPRLLSVDQNMQVVTE
ncbi:MAG: hypothetical protein JWO13_2670 [Acidobacteriales bacterium]|nr:hypothetical protein [Terriglobales bacterium]